MPKKKKRFPKTGMPTNAEGINDLVNPPAAAKGQAQDQGRRVTAPGHMKLGYKAIYNDLPDLVERADAGDKQAKKLLRSGKYAFPHLRDFGKLPDLKGETLIDNFISVLTTNPKHLYANYKNKENQRTMKQMAVVLKRAHRFTIDDDLLERVLFDSATAQWEKIFEQVGEVASFLQLNAQRQRQLKRQCHLFDRRLHCVRL